jgi:hypothetical protein
MLGQIVVAWNRDEKRLLVSRLIRFDHTDVLLSDRRENQAVLLGAEFKWRIVGGVLWWTGRPQQSRWKAPTDDRRFALDFEISHGVAL